MGLESQVTDSHCVEGWSVHDAPWDGIRLSRIIADVKPLPGARFVKIGCARGDLVPVEYLIASGSYKEVSGNGSGDAR